MNRNEGSVVTFHGSILKTPKFSEKQTVSHFARDVPSDILVTIGGTGVMAYNTANVKIDFESFKRIADEVRSFKMDEIAHIAGLLASKIHPNPIP